MYIRPFRFILAISVSMLAIACRDDGIRPNDSSWFRGSIEGNITRGYEGTGYFAPLRDYAESPYYFKIYSEGTGASSGEALFLKREIAERPQPGAYSLVPHETPYGSSEGWTGLYRRSSGDNVREPHVGELYIIQSGELEITRASGREVEGTVRFTAVLVYRIVGNDITRDNPRHIPDPDAPTIELIGSFRATFFPEARL